MSSLKKQLEIAENKLAFFEEKKLIGGLSLDQEFALKEDIKALKTTIADLKEKISNSNSENSNHSDNGNQSDEANPTKTNQKHEGEGDNVGGGVYTFLPTVEGTIYATSGQSQPN